MPRTRTRLSHHVETHGDSVGDRATTAGWYLRSGGTVKAVIHKDEPQADTPQEMFRPTGRGATGACSARLDDCRIQV
jgi:hypothetical protein